MKSRLDKVGSFHATFTQKSPIALGAAGTQEDRSDLWVKRPNLFNWHMTQPDEYSGFHGGKTLWFYNPFVEQAATATWLKRYRKYTVYADCPQRASDWQQYNIKQDGDNFCADAESQQRQSQTVHTP
ncbi:outer membrane lipoprotein chaperone LolA [Salmonella enterica subsp. enterica]|nr:outer membrane lipoprotein chaperone LolA [Salmonella enterica subsp. enterica]